MKFDPVHWIASIAVGGITLAVCYSLASPSKPKEANPVPVAQVAPPPASAIIPLPVDIRLTTEEITSDPTSKKGAAKIESVKAAALAVANECGHLPLWAGATVKLGGYVDGKTKYVNISVDVINKANVSGNTLWYRVRLDKKGAPDAIKPEKEISASACGYAAEDGRDGADADTALGHLGHQ